MSRKCCMCGKVQTNLERAKEMAKFLASPPNSIVKIGDGFNEVGGKVFCSFSCYHKYMEQFEGQAWIEEIKRQHRYDGDI